MKKVTIFASALALAFLVSSVAIAQEAPAKKVEKKETKKEEKKEAKKEGKKEGKKEEKKEVKGAEKK